jgi:hypothetical protein
MTVAKRRPITSEFRMKTKMMLLLSLGFVVAAQPVAPEATVEIAFARSVAAGAPVDTASAFDATVGQVAGWTRVTGLTAGSKITHVWIHGADTSRVELNIGGSPWRTYSRKTIPSGATGDWTLEVWSADGAKLATKTFKIG